MKFSNITGYFKRIIKKPSGSENIPHWQIYTLWILRILTLLSGIRQTFFGETAIGIVILLLYVIITAPSIISWKTIKSIPIELEIIFFIMVFLQFIVGEARDFYTNVPYYDKLVHFMLPLFLGFMGFILIYMLYATKRLHASLPLMFIVTFLIAMGIGAVWEIIEYSSDMLILPRFPGWHKFQGSLTEDPYHDTMNDLVADMLGAIVGASLATFYVLKSKNKRVNEMFNELAEEFYT